MNAGNIYFMKTNDQIDEFVLKQHSQMITESIPGVEFSLIILFVVMLAVFKKK